MSEKAPVAGSNMLTEAAPGAIAQAIVLLAIDVFDVEARVRQWLGRNPAKLAIQKALARTYTAFARQYPTSPQDYLINRF